MLKLPMILLSALALASHLAAQDQMLIVDRAPGSGPTQSLGLPEQAKGFLADDFQAGSVKEVWVIDHIRVWAISDPRAISPHGMGALFKKISLYGGIAPDPTSPSEKASADCECHNLPALTTALLEPDSNSTDHPDVKVSSARQPDGSEVWQIDFEKLEWSVPGGTAIQFGVLADSYPSYTWYSLGSSATGGDHLRVFSSVGKLQGPLQPTAAARMNVQVWGHLLATISIRSAGNKFRVTLWGTPFLAANQVDTASLRFGPANESPDNVHADNEKPDLVMDFRLADSGITPKSLNACLTGKRLDGAPFEGCDLLRH